MSLQRIAHDVEAVLARTQPAQAPAPDGEPLLCALAEARARRAAADADLRNLLAYARMFAGPHPYTLSELAEACGMSASGVRVAYGPDDIAAVTAATGLQPVPGRREGP